MSEEIDIFVGPYREHQRRVQQIDPSKDDAVLLGNGPWDWTRPIPVQDCFDPLPVPDGDEVTLSGVQYREAFGRNVLLLNFLYALDSNLTAETKKALQCRKIDYMLMGKYAAQVLNEIYKPE